MSNVWAPEHRTGKLPVLVWIYGGGFVNGGSSPAVYDGTQFAKHGLIFVSFNYRLGRFGFFAHPALTKERKDGLLGNYGYMDQIAAMKWVQRNIAAFDGDPKQVTVFGESAGGGSVHMLMALKHFDARSTKSCKNQAIFCARQRTNLIWPRPLGVLNRHHCFIRRACTLSHPSYCASRCTGDDNIRPAERSTFVMPQVGCWQIYRFYIGIRIGLVLTGKANRDSR